MIKKLAKKRPEVLFYEELEDRLLFSGDALPGLDGDGAEAHLLVEDAANDTVKKYDDVLGAADQEREAPSRELVFINDNVADQEHLIADLQSNDTNRIIEVAILQSDRDGIDQITEILAERSELSAIHFITHGAEGRINLGSGWLNHGTLQQNSDKIATWGNALTESGDILFYGCNVAADSDGRSLVGGIARLTEADVAASDDLTGHAGKNGDWTLEYCAGSIETTGAFSPSGETRWKGTLDTYEVTNTNDSGAGSLRQAIIDANSRFGADTIEFNIDPVDLAADDVINLDSELPAITDTVAIDGSTQSGYADHPVIIIDGEQLASTGFSLSAGAGGSTIRGLVLRDFSGNAIQIDAGSNNNTIVGNYIGSLGTGGPYAGPQEENGGAGIYIAGANNTIGGTAAGAGNMIAYNAQGGVVLSSGAGTGNTILRNAIHDNGGLGIDLSDNGVTTNDAGDGDGLQNFPVLTNVISIGGDTTIAGTLNSNADTTYRIEFFSSPTADSSGYGEGQTYMGFVSVTTDGSGDAGFNPTFTGVTVAGGQTVSATATVDLGGGNYGSTSEFAGSLVQPNNGPTAFDDSFTVGEGSTTNLDLAANDGDADDGLDLTTIAIVSGPTNGSIVVRADGTVDYSHDGSETVADSFTYTIDDLAGSTSNTVTVSLTITPVNDAPVATADSFSVSEGFTIYEGSITTLNLAANDTDADDGLDLTSIAIVSGPANGSIVVNADGTVDYTHDGSETVSDSFTYTIDDLSGSTSNTVTVSLMITPVNGPPEDDNPEGGDATGSSPSDSKESGWGDDGTAASEPTAKTALTNDSPSENGRVPAVEESGAPRDSGIADDSVDLMENAGSEETIEKIYLAGDSSEISPEEWDEDSSFIYFGNDLYRELSSPSYSLLKFNATGNNPDFDRPADFGNAGHGWEQVVNEGDFNLLRDEIDIAFIKEQKSAVMTMRILTVTIATFTAGVVTFLLRTGSLVAGMVSTLSFWRGFDPIIVLSGARKRNNSGESRHSDECQAETLFDDKR